MRLCTRITLKDDGSLDKIIDISLVSDDHSPDLADGTIHIPGGKITRAEEKLSSAWTCSRACCIIR